MAITVHPSAIIHPDAQIDEGAFIGPYCIIHGDVTIGANTRLESHVVVEPGTRIGPDCTFWPGGVIGGPPQDRKYKGERSFLILGANNLVREYVTLHRAVGEGQSTRIGSNNMIMAYVHVGHNCHIGDNNTFSSYTGLAGHVLVEDNVVLGGMVGVHQYCRIGKIAMVGGLAKVNQDIPPFMISDGVPARVLDINKIGLRRQGLSPNTRAVLRQAFKFFYRSNLNFAQAMERIEDELEPCDELDYLLTFVQGIKGYGRGNEDTQ